MNPHVMTPDAKIYAAHNPDRRTPLPRDHSPFFAPVEVEDDPSIVAESTPLFDWLFIAGGFCVAGVVVGCVAAVGWWAWRHL